MTKLFQLIGCQKEDGSRVGDSISCLYVGGNGQGYGYNDNSGYGHGHCHGTGYPRVWSGGYGYGYDNGHGYGHGHCYSGEGSESVGSGRGTSQSTPRTRRVQ